jgi:hypothetical protein
MKAVIDKGLSDVSVHHLYMSIRVQIHGHKSTSVLHDVCCIVLLLYMDYST